LVRASELRIRAESERLAQSYRLTRILRRFDHVANRGQKLIRYRSVNHSMIKAQRQDPNLSNGDRVIDHNRTLLDRAHAQYRYLRLVDYRSARPAAKYARVRDCKSPALHFIGLELLCSRALAKIVHRTRKPKQRFFIRIANPGNNQSQIERDRHADVHVFLVDDLIAPQRRVDDGPLLDAFNHGLDDERHECQLDPVTLLKLTLQLITKLRGLGEVDFHERSDVRRNALAFDHPFSDRPAHDRHRLDLDAVAFGVRRRTDFSFCRGGRSKRLRRASWGSGSARSRSFRNGFSLFLFLWRFFYSRFLCGWSLLDET